MQACIFKLAFSFWLLFGYWDDNSEDNTDNDECNFNPNGSENPAPRPRDVASELKNDEDCSDNSDKRSAALLSSLSSLSAVGVVGVVDSSHNINSFRIWCLVFVFSLQ